MCVVAIALEAHPKWRLLVAGNRDEFHTRASAPLARWDEPSNVIAGRDLVSGGTWMGVSDAGRFAVVTNIRDADGPSVDKKSRGALVSSWLAQGTLPSPSEQFNPYNLIVSDRQSLQFVSNRPEPTQCALPSGIHGLSNAIPDEHWPRKDRLMEGMRDWLKGSATSLAALLDLLSKEEAPDRGSLPIFIRSAVYGTRASTVVAVDDAGCGQIIERSFESGGAISGERSLTFGWSQWPAPAGT